MFKMRVGMTEDQVTACTIRFLYMLVFSANFIEKIDI